MSYANVVATLALFVALGGSSYAAIKLAKNSVKSRHIARGQVKNSDLAGKAVTASKVKAGSLTRALFKDGELPASFTGPVGPAGAPGQPGPQGARGTAVNLIKLDHPVQFPANAIEVELPLAGAAFTQGAQELDMVYAQVTVEKDGAEACSGEGNGIQPVRLDLDGEFYDNVATGGLGPWGQRDPQELDVLTPPGADKNRTVTARVFAVCDGGGTFTISQLDITVLRFG